MSFWDYSPLGSALGMGSKPAPTLLDQAGYTKGAANQSKGKENKLFDTNNKSLDWITGPDGDPTSSPLYKSFLTKSRSSIGNAYDNAVMNSRATAASRGFGYASPNTGQAEIGLRGQEASDIGAAPTKALQDTMPFNMEALKLRGAEAGTYAGQSMAEEQMSNEDYLQRDKSKQANQSGLMSGLSSVASTLLSNPELLAMMA